MKNKIVGIVVLMLVATMVVSATNNNVKKNIQMATSGDVLPTVPGINWGVDQKNIYHSGYGITLIPPEINAQSFIPTKDKLTAVSLGLFKAGTPQEPVQITVSIRDNLTGSDLASKTIDTSVVTIGKAKWILFDFEDISITPGNTYFIVCSGTAGNADNAYCWLFANNDTYTPGEAWHKPYNWSGWIIWPSGVADFCFKTYFRKPLDSSIPATVPSSPLGTNAVVWSKTYGGPEFDELRCVQETTDGGYIACGETELSNNICSWVLKVDASGNEEWNWTQTQFHYNETYYDIIDAYSVCVQQVDDGGYVVILQLSFMLNTEQLWFGGSAKLNAAGAEEWVQIYAEEFVWSFTPYSMIIEDDGYLLVGSSQAPEVPVTDCAAAILKTNTNGVEQWHQEYQYSSGYDEGYAVCRTTDNGYLITGDVDITLSNSDYWMIKTDANGNEQWNKTFGGPSSEPSNVGNCYQTSDGGYIQGGYTYSYGAGISDVWMVKTDSSGTMEWNKTYGDSSRDGMWSFEQTNDAGYVICRYNNFTGVVGDKEDIILIKIDENGNTKWIQKFGGPDRQLGIYVNNTRDGGFIVSGRTGAYQAATTDGRLVKFAPVDIEIAIQGGLGIKATIKNNGIANLTNVSYELQVKGGILGRINKTINGWINIFAGETIPTEKIMVFGLGSITITAKIADKEQTVTGTQIIILSLVKK